MPNVQDAQRDDKTAKTSSSPKTIAELLVEHLDGQGGDGRHRAALVEALLEEPKALEALANLTTDAKRKAAAKNKGRLPGRTMSALVDEILDFAKRPRMGWGIEDLDRCAPWPTKSVATLIGPTGRGKTSFALQVARHHAETRGPSLFMSAELAALVVAARGAAQITTSTWLDVLSGSMTRADLVWALDCPNLVIVDDIDEEWPNVVESYFAHWKKTQPGKTPLVVLDYYQILPAPGNDEKERLKFVMSESMRLAKDFDGAVLGLSKTARTQSRALRAGEAIGDATTEAGAESNAIEYGSAVQIALGQIIENADGTATMEANISKVRYGRGDFVVPLGYNGAHGWFRSTGTAAPATEIRQARAKAMQKTKEQAKRDGVIAALASGPLPASALRERVGGRRTDLAELLRVLVEEGAIVHEHAGNGLAGARYRLVVRDAP
jgi:hypothetical protein